MILSDGKHAHYYQRLAWANAFNSLPGWDAKLWWPDQTPAYDAFDMYEPDILLAQTYNLNKPLIKCIEERPHLKVGLRAPDWGSQVTDDKRFRILKASEEEKKLVEQLRERTGQPEFLHIHYPEYALKETHDKWAETGVPVKSIMMCADVNSYAGARYVDAFACDIGFVGGYWPYKGRVIDKYLLPICDDKDLRIKIFGNQPWTETDRYCGMLQDNNVRHLFASAKICPNLSEPHAQEYGYDVNERVFKTLFCGGFVISDYVEGLEKTLHKDLQVGEFRGYLYAEDESEFRDLIYAYLEDDYARKKASEAGRKIVCKSHTNFHRVEELLNAFGIEEPKIKEYQNAIK